MPTLTLTFQLPEDEAESQLALNAGKYWKVLYEYDAWLRKQIKYPPEAMSDEWLNCLQVCREQLHEMRGELMIDF